MPAATFKEKAVVEIWQQYLITRTDLETEDGRPIKVVYPGMINGDRGADLVDAVIHTGRRQVQGSVEIHVNSSGWWGHGHHEDPAYNGVILHVVYWHDREKVIHLQNGNTIPTLVLSKFIKSRFDRSGSAASCPVFQNMPCRDIVHQQSGALLEETLDAAG